jgi:uncharacterized protein YkvS
MNLSILLFQKNNTTYKSHIAIMACNVSKLHYLQHGQRGSRRKVDEENVIVDKNVVTSCGSLRACFEL